MQGIPKKELSKVLNWAEERLSEEGEAPWDWYQLMKLREVVGLILNGVDPLSPKEGLPQSGKTVGPVLQLVNRVNRNF